MSHILIIEDEKVIRTALARLLQRHGHEIAEAGSIVEAEQQHGLNFDLIIADLRLPGLPGTDVITRAPDVPVLIMTSYASVRSAVEAMKQGAVDYIAKPFDHEEMVMTVNRILKESDLSRENAALRLELSRYAPLHGMIGKSPAMREIAEHIGKVAPTNATVLILGESGTGKELVARALHDRSARSKGPFIIVNCAAIPEMLIESELFGHERGAFTGAVSQRKGLVEAANGGTLFLDEIGELPMAAQARLLRVMQEGEIRRVGADQSRRIDIRLLAATHRSLEQMVDSSEFRQDLFFRLRVMEIRLPSLRERSEDIPELAVFLLHKACQRLNKQVLRFRHDALEVLRSYHWPGNVRELENVIERAVILTDGDTIEPKLLAIGAPAAEVAGAEGKATVLSLDEYFRQFVLQNQDRMTETDMARQLGITRKTLWERRQRIGIPRPRALRETVQD